MYEVIKSKADLKRFIEADSRVNEDRDILKYLRLLRRYELVVNKHSHMGGVINMIGYLIWKHRWARVRRRYGIYLSPCCIASGLKLPEKGYIWVDGSSQIGSGCIIESNVLLGKKRPGLKPPLILIGDNCHICADTTILGPVRIGDDVTILQGSVVIKDIPDHCVAGGCPAEVIRRKTK